MSATAAGPSDPRHAAIAVFARWVDGRASGEAEGFEDLVAANAPLATELHAIRADWDRAQVLLEELGLTQSLGERLRKRYGSQADPGISLEGEGRSEKPGDFTSEVFRRLAGRRGEIGRYHLRGEIASGGQGAILRVWDEDLRRHLAMKVLLGQAALARSGETPPVDSRTLGRFLEEAQVTGQLDHPGIVPVHELGLDSAGRVFFTMKLVQGRTLKEVYELEEGEREGWTRTRVLSVMLKVCEAIAYAHHKGVVHRDLKPANVMVGRFGEVFVMDWGLAKVLGRVETKDVRLAPLPKTTSLQSERQEADSGPDSPLMTMDGDVVGTPAYMAPEQAQGKIDAIGPHTDVYAVGAMLYHLLTRQMPYCPPGGRVTNRTILAMLLQGPPAPLHELQKDIPAELEAICDKAMARDPRQRYRNTSTLAEDLGAFLEGRVVKAYESGAWAEGRKWIQRNMGLATALSAAVVLLVVGLAVSLVYKVRADRNAVLAREGAEEAKNQAAIARVSEQRALAGEQQAGDEKERAEKKADEVLRLSALQKLDDLVSEADRLWPAVPENIQRYQDWLTRAQGLVDELPKHEASLAELRARARIEDPHERAGPGGTAEPPVIAALRLRLESQRAELRAEILGGAGEYLEQEWKQALSEGIGQAALPEALQAVLGQDPRLASINRLVRQVGIQERMLTALEVEPPFVQEALIWDSSEDRWWHGQLTKLVDLLRAFADPSSGLISGISSDHGWGVKMRLDFARFDYSEYARAFSCTPAWTGWGLMSDTSVGAGALIAATKSYTEPDARDALFEGWTRSGNVERLELGRSAGDRELFGVQFGSPGQYPLSERTTIFLVGGVDGVSLSGSQAVVTVVSELLERLADLPSEIAFVAIPWANPDGLVRWSRNGTGGGRNDRPFDDDGDGRLDEDGPDDLDRDGMILEMLVEDQVGLWERTGGDPRLLQVARGPQSRRYLRLREGADEDGDSKSNEDGPGGVVIDHNFPVEQEDSRAPEAGPAPLSEPETGALAELLARRKAAAVLVFQGNHGMLAAPGGRTPGGGPLLRGEDRSEYERLVAVLNSYRSRLQPRLISLFEARGEPWSGSLVDWSYARLGALSMEISVWGPNFRTRLPVEPSPQRNPLATGLLPEQDEPTVETSWASWVDDERGGVGLIDWQPIDLASSRETWIGGWEPETVFNPPPDMLPRVLRGLSAFVLDLARNLPRLEVELREAKREGKVCLVRARIKNLGTLTAGIGTGPSSVVRLRLETQTNVRIVAGQPTITIGRLTGRSTSEEYAWILVAPEGALVRLVVESPWMPAKVRELRL